MGRFRTLEYTENLKISRTPDLNEEEKVVFLTSPSWGAKV